jgi:two-component system, OmpR family, response regulator
MASEAEMTERAPRVLVVDDEEHITELLFLGLSMNGFEVERVSSGRAALNAIEEGKFDLIVLDVMLPDLNGFDVTKRLRQTERSGTRIPVIFLTARDTTADKIEGLRLGSDDYMTKPFSIEELVERVKAVLRRSSGIGPGSNRLSFEDLEMDLDTREVWRGGRLVELTPTEYKLLHYLLANARRVLTREQILEQVWEYTFSGNASVLETYISYLRQKIDHDGAPLIHTVRGVGYTLRLSAK